MGQVLHGCATTTEAIRRAIQNSQESLRVLASRHHQSEGQPPFTSSPDWPMPVIPSTDRKLYFACSQIGRWLSLTP